jgi:anti-anti-sigma regulatory factor
VIPTRPSFLVRFLAPAQDPEVARRQFVLAMTASGLFLLGLLWTAADLLVRAWSGPVAVDIGSGLLLYLGIGGGLVIAAVAYALARHEKVTAAGFLLIAEILAFTVWRTWQMGIEIGGAVLYVVAIALAGLVAGSKGTMITATLAFLFYSGMGLLQQLGVRPIPLAMPLLPSVVGFGLVLYLVTALNWISNRHLNSALQKAQWQAAELHAAREQQALLLVDLQAQTKQQAHLLRAVEDLAAPVIVIHDQIVVLPLVGYVDSHRAELIRQALLQGISRHRAAIALIDLTGLPQISKETVRHLEAMSHAGRLLGAEVVLVGIHAQAAAEMIQSGADLCSLQTRRNLQSGIEWALARMGKRIVPDGDHAELVTRSDLQAGIEYALEQVRQFS